MLHKPFITNGSFVATSLAVKMTAEGLDTAFVILATVPDLIEKPCGGYRSDASKVKFFLERLVTSKTI